jgi:alpha-glucosidase
VAAEREDRHSMLQLYGKLIALRKAHPALVSGELHAIQVEQNVLRYRRSGVEEVEVILNMTHEQRAVPVARGTVLAGTHVDREREAVDGQTVLRAAEGVVVLLA